MFDLIVNRERRTTRRGLAPLALSWAVHTMVIGAGVLLPLLVTRSHLPAAPEEILTFVTVVPPPAPPPPAPPPAARPAVQRPAPRPAPAPPVAPAPVRAPELPPSIDVATDGEGDYDVADGVTGGVAGGVPGGVPAGVVGSVTEVALPPPPPSPLPAPPREPVRTGGRIQAPALLTRVPPIYPPIAVKAQVQGIVILEATVGRDGRVEEVGVIRSIPLLDKAAVDAVRQWVYAPLLLNGQAERFILTVTVTFDLS